MISRSEAAYIATSFQPGPEEDAPAIRADGRSAFAYRPISLALGVAPQANGSARCAIGGTDVLVGCKLEVSEGSRRLACSVEWYAGPSQTRAGKLFLTLLCDSSPGALNTLPSDPSQELTDFLSSLLHPLRASPQLFISPRQHWCLFVDAVVVSADGGNLYDTIAMAARMAVGDVLIPRTRPAVYQAPKDAPSAGAEDAEAAGIKGLLRGQKGRRTNDAKAVDFELLDREAGQGMTWQNRESIPVVVTLNLVRSAPPL